MRSSHRKTKVIELNPVPHYISEDKSDMRGIKSGWYAMDKDGNLVAGPFASREKCVLGNIQQRMVNADCLLKTSLPEADRRSERR
jgi:hypothetical protein